jgi:hypothetical protein
MSTVDEAFDKFRSRLEVTPTEETSASSRQKKIREYLKASSIEIETDFLTGSYVRDTKTKPLRDVDIMIVLRDTSYLDKHPSTVLEDVRAVLAGHYGEHRVCTDQRAVRVDFGINIVDDVTDGEVISFDVVPAVQDGDHYLIPDDQLGVWIATNPKEHKTLTTQTNKDYSEKWKPLVKMIKKWNEHAGSPVFPSFLLETMALEIITGGWTGNYPYELRMFFATAADQIDRGWGDPAKVGPDVSNALDSEPVAMSIARTALVDAEKACTAAIGLARGGNNGAAVTAWRALFGPLFPAS